MNFDVFISYPHQDKAVADAACARLEGAGIRCWIAPRDVPPGAEWAGAIVDAIDHCRAMVLIFSSSTNESKQIRREVQQAFDGEKPVVPFRIENVVPEKSLRYYMGSVHWLDALTLPLDQHLQKLATSVGALVGITISDGEGTQERALREAEGQRQVQERARRGAVNQQKADQLRRESEEREAEIRRRAKEQQRLRDTEAQHRAEDVANRRVPPSSPTAARPGVIIGSLIALAAVGVIGVLLIGSQQPTIPSQPPPASPQPVAPSAQPPPMPVQAPTLTQSDQLIGRWGYGSYRNENDRATEEVAAKDRCGQPIVINRGPNGGVMMYLADSAQLTELFLKRGSNGRIYIGPPGNAGALPDREVMSYDGNTMIARWVNREVQSRYATAIYVRCTG
jgi:hypothetical protein